MKKYEVGKTYKKLGEYQGIIDVHPYNEDYYMKVHRFVEKSKNVGESSKVTEIEIEKISKNK